MENVPSFPTTAKAPRSLKAPIKRSGWVQAVRYHQGFLVVFTKTGSDHGEATGAFIFEGVPKELCGLVLAGTGGRSVGHALHRLLREVKEDGTLGDWKYKWQYVKGGKELKELKEMMK